ncbi:MAG: hypothetical protein RIS35_2940 [Pseudomonadota bacterium]
MRGKRTVEKIAKLRDDGEVRELTAQDMAGFKPAKDVLPPELYAGLVEMNRRAGVRGPQKAPTKERITIRLSPTGGERPSFGCGEARYAQPRPRGLLVSLLRPKNR